MPAVLRGAALLALPAAVLAGAFLFVFYSAALPRPLSGLEIYAPYLAFAIGAVLAVTFKRGRAARPSRHPAAGAPSFENADRRTSAC